jgi:DHA3 family macrolide efflux protein-like MFS transporter
MQAVADKETFRHYLYFFFGQQFSLLGSSVVQFAIIWWITLATADTVYLSLAAFVGFAPMVVLVPFTGVLADRWNRKILIAVADFLQAFTTVILILLFWSRLASVPVVLGALGVRGICQAFHVPAASAIVPAMVPQDKLSRMNGLDYVTNGIVMLAGPVIGALLLVFASIEQVLWIDPATFAIALIPLILIRIPHVRDTHEKTSFKKDFAEGLGFVKHTNGLLPLIFLATALNFLLMPVATLLPYFVKFDHLGNVTDLALVSALINGGMLSGGLFMTVRKGFQKGTAVFMVSILVAQIGYALISLTPYGVFWFMGMAGLIHGFPVPIANVSVRTILQKAVPLKMQGRVNSVIVSLASLATPAGMIMSGTLAKYTGTAPLFLGCALLGILVLVPSWFLTSIRRLDMVQNDTSNADSVRA